MKKIPTMYERIFENHKVIGTIEKFTDPSADPITGHLPCWVPVDKIDPADKWFYKLVGDDANLFIDGTYEAVGKHFNGNPYNCDDDYLILHGSAIIKNLHRDFDGIYNWLESNTEEGIVFWDPDHDHPVCKIKRSDFGLEWPIAYYPGIISAR